MAGYTFPLVPGFVELIVGEQSFVTPVHHVCHSANAVPGGPHSSSRTLKSLVTTVVLAAVVLMSLEVRGQHNASRCHTL